MNDAVNEYNDVGIFEICKVANYKINYNNTIKVVKKINEISQMNIVVVTNIYTLILFQNYM
jgi:hypothetical protein